MIKYRVKQIIHRQPWLINGKWIDRGWVVTSPQGMINMTPGAGWYVTLERAFKGVEAIEKSGCDINMFHEVYRELTKDLPV